MTSDEATQKLQSYIHTRGHTPVYVTKHLVRFWWKVLNAAVFDNKLPNARRVEIIDSTEVHAWAIPSSNDRIDLHFHHKFLERTTFLTVLIHEMVHAWEFMTYGRMGHGKRFASWSHIVESRTPLLLRKAIHYYEHGRTETTRRRNTKRSLGGNVCQTIGQPTDTHIPTPHIIA